MKDYVKAGYTPPPFASYTYGIKNWGMMMNDTLGDCTIAACGHAVQVWTQGKITVPDSLVESYYEKWCGYVPGNPNTDNGGVELDILNDWKTQTFGGHVLEGYVDPKEEMIIEGPFGDHTGYYTPRDRYHRVAASELGDGSVQCRDDLGRRGERRGRGWRSRGLLPRLPHAGPER
jgi:hypothetical protein